MKAVTRFIVALLLPALLAAAGCSTNASTGRKQLLFLSTQESIAIGEESKGPLIEEYGGAMTTAQLRAYVSTVGTSLASRTEASYPSLPWEFTVLDSDVINAFALPGGKVFVSRGLMERLDSEAQLAGVLGHEIGHVTAEHVNERVSQAMIVQGVVLGTAVAANQSDSDWAAVVPLLVGVGGQGYLLHFNRNQESEADRQGVKYMVAAGYDPKAMIEVILVLKSSAASGPRPPEFLSTHPDPDRRIASVHLLLAGPYANARDNPDLKDYRDRYHSEALPYLSPARAALPPPAAFGNSS